MSRFSATKPPSSVDPLRVFIVAGEDSGDLLGADLMRALRTLLGEESIVFLGVGGVAMEAEGFVSLFPMNDLSVLGVAAVLGRLRLILKRIRQTAQAILQARPDIVVMIDSPDFTHRVAARVRRKIPSIPLVNYAPPTVWAWRKGRLKKMKHLFVKALAIFPFEPDFYAQHGGPPCVYIGHPLERQLKTFKPTKRASSFVRVQGLGHRKPLILIAPGSRVSVFRRLFPIFRRTIERLRSVYPEAVCVLPLSRATAALAREALKEVPWPTPLVLLEKEDEKYAAMQICDLALSVAGTVNLELAFLKIPMVVVMKMPRWENRVLQLLIALKMVRAKYFCLVNILLDRPVIEEYLQEKCVPDDLFHALVGILKNPQKEKKIRDDLELFCHAFVTDPRQGYGAAREVLDVLGLASILEARAS